MGALTVAGPLERPRAGEGNVFFPELEDIKAKYSQNSASERQLKAMLGLILPNHGQTPLNEPPSAAISVLSAP